MSQPHPTQRRNERYAIRASIELVDEQRTRVLRAECSNISISGCYVETRDPFLVWTRLKLRIAYLGQVFNATGAVMHSAVNVGMGIEFQDVAAADRAVLDGWLAQSAEKKA